MANNLIQIKKSLTTAVPTSLANGELAFTANGDVLYIGSNSTIVAIGGKRTPGTLTANQALVANSTGSIDTVKTANLVVTKIYANGAHGTAGQVLTSNGGGEAFWVSPTAGVAGSNTQVQFNDSDSLGGSDGFTFDKASNTLTVSNTISVGANVKLTTAVLSVGNSSVNTVVNSSSVSTNSVTGFTVTAANAVITKIYAGGAHGTAGQLLTANSTGGVNWVAPATEVSALNDLTDVAVSSASAGQILIANSTGFFRNVTLSGDVTIDSSGVATLGAGSIELGTDTTGDYVATITAGDGISGSSTGEGGAPTIAVVAGTGVVSNSTGVHIGQAVATTDNVTFANVSVSNTLTVTGFSDLANGDIGDIKIRGSNVVGGQYDRNIIDTGVSGLILTGGNYGVQIKAANDGVNFFTTTFNPDNGAILAPAGVNAASFTVGANFIANATAVTMNNDVTVGSSSADIVTVNAGVASNLIPSANITYDLGSSAKRWKDLYLSGTTITIGDATISATSGTISLGNTVHADLNVTGNTSLGNNTADVISFGGRVDTNILPAANITHSLGNNTNRWLEVHAQNVHSEYLYIDKDVTISGNLVVSGNLVTVNVSTLSVTDSLIQLASNNTISDTLDIGFFGSYQVSAGDHEHAGLFRDATDDTFKLFKGLTASPTTTVDTSNNTYTVATLEAYLNSGALTTNATAVAVTANSTVAVNITANSITLTTALGTGSGGTGLSSVTNNAILVGNSSSGYSQLGLGTDGYILQSNGTSLVYATLDGGTF